MWLWMTVFCLSLTSASSLQKSEASNVNPQRTAYLMEHFLGGKKNIRWETRPMSTVDSKGNPVSGMGNVDCMDTNGQLRKEGEEYERASGKFKYQCTKGEEQVTACIGSDRTKKARIPVGDNLEVDGFWHKCQSFSNGSVVYYQEPSCTDTKGKEVHIGDEITIGYLRVSCIDGGYKTVGCVFHENGQEVVLREGESKEVGKYTHNCENLDGNLQYSSKAQGCTKFEKNLKEGDVFSENHLHYKCSNGLADITGCYANEHKDLSIGEDYVQEGVLHRCYRTGTAVEYQEYPCQGDACHPVPVKGNSEQALGHGLQSPGFGAFAVVQRIGGSDQVKSPSSIKFDLDKLTMGRQG